jgi:hypothetical protein
LKLRKRNWLLLLIFFLLVSAWPGFTLLKGLTFSKRTLERPNPTSYVFSAPIDRVRSAIDAQFSSIVPEKQWGFWMPTGLDVHGSNETEYELMQHGFAESDVYHWGPAKLPYWADFNLFLAPVSDSTTQVNVQTLRSMVRIGPTFAAPGGNYFEPVPPTSIEEYRILLKIGSALGERAMPPLSLPQH